jgi:hypothetical protein
MNNEFYEKYGLLTIIEINDELPINPNSTKRQPKI